MHDFSLISPPSSHDHFPSAFLQGFPPSAFDSLSTTPLERFLQPDHDRRMVDLPPFMPRQPPARTYPFEYMNTPIAPPRPLSGFDPRPPHAGWTPKEEVDEDAQTRELLARASASPAETPTPGEMPGADSVRAVPRACAPTPPADDAPQTPLRKMYSFISLPGNAVRKRPRRRYDEIERLYACAWPGCDKAYGTLNHLNAHVNMQRHGAKRSPAGECAHARARADGLTPAHRVQGAPRAVAEAEEAGAARGAAAARGGAAGGGGGRRPVAGVERVGLGDDDVLAGRAAVAGAAAAAVAARRGEHATAAAACGDARGVAGAGVARGAPIRRVWAARRRGGVVRVALGRGGAADVRRV